MTIIFTEKFETVGYDNTGWVETLGGATIDEDADTSDVGSPSGWGAKCLKMISGDTNATHTYNQLGDAAIRYIGFKVIFSDLSNLTTSGDVLYVAGALNYAITTYCWYVRAQVVGTDILLALYIIYDGSAAVVKWGAIAREDIEYNINIKWDKTNDRCDWKINGTQYEGSDLLTGSVQMGTILLGLNYTTDLKAGTRYYDSLKIDDSDWIDYAGMILREHFEPTGYDNTGWTESVGTGSTVDEDADVADVDSPVNWGSKCLKILANDNATYTYRQTAAENILYYRVEFIITAEGLANETGEPLIAFYDYAVSASPVVLYFGKDISGNLSLFLFIDDDGAGFNIYPSNVTPVIDTKYRFEIKWDSTNDAWAWKIDGVSQANNIDSTHPINSEGTLTGTHVSDIGFILLGTGSWNSEGYTAYYDLVACSTDDWLGDWLGETPYTGPFYKEGSLSGTIPGAGFAGTIYLVGDE